MAIAARLIAICAALLLAGCASTRGYYYDGGYYARDGYAYDRSYRHGGIDYYAGGYSGYGDYWYADPGYRYPGYFDTPYYYSLFYPINRWYYDPFWYPGYYYGVTWFPRNYLSFSLGWNRWSGWGPYGGHFAYSPYRYGWSDWYYDWYPWYRAYPHYHRHYERPRFGNPRNEAERLARLDGAQRAYKRGNFASVRPAAGRAQAAGMARGASRGLPASRGALPSRSAPMRAAPARGAAPGRASPRSEVLRAPQARLDRGAPLRLRSSESMAPRDGERFERQPPVLRDRAQVEAAYRMRNLERDAALRSGAPQYRAGMPQRALAPDGAAPRMRSSAPAGGYDVGVRSAPPVRSQAAPSRSVEAAPPVRSAPAPRSAPPSRSEVRGRGRSEER